MYGEAGVSDPHSRLTRTATQRMANAGVSIAIKSARCIVAIGLHSPPTGVPAAKPVGGSQGGVACTAPERYRRQLSGVRRNREEQSQGYHDIDIADDAPRPRRPPYPCRLPMTRHPRPCVVHRRLDIVPVLARCFPPAAKVGLNLLPRFPLALIASDRIAGVSSRPRQVT